jgi:hypothetical protein
LLSGFNISLRFHQPAERMSENSNSPVSSVASDAADATNGTAAVELGIGGLIDLAHATLADESIYRVVAESGADVESHGLLGLI